MNTPFSGITLNWLLGLIAIWSSMNSALGTDFHAGFLFDDHELTLANGRQTQILGPLFYDQHIEEEHTWAIPPLLSYTKDRGTDLTEFDFAYPILTYDRYGSQYRWQLFQLLSFSGGPSPGETNVSRITLFPIYFQQRSSDPSENYTAVGPFYGHLKRHLFRDEIFFVMFPVFSETRRGEVITDNYLFPFFHLRHGPGLTGWQFWPLIGHEHKDITTRTNLFGETESVPGHDSSFILWPLYFNDHSELGTDNPIWQQGVLPLYALERSPQRNSTTVLWPFFSRVDDRKQKYHEWDAPWPLIVFARGEGKYMTRVWPFFSHAHNATLESDFYLWPVYKYDRINSAPLDRQRHRILFFVYSDILQKNTETGRSSRRTDLWPLFTRRRDFNGNTRFQAFAFLEVWTLGSHKIERDYSPAWSVWVSEHNPSTGARSQSLLWNLYRHEAAPEHHSVSALFGLFQYQGSPTGKRVRLLYIPFGKKPAPPAPAKK